MKITLVVCCIILLFGVFLLIKNEITLRNRIKINEAIYDYLCACAVFDPDSAVDFTDTEHYMRTLFRLWDFGYKRILPKDKFEVIKPYIK